MEKAGAEWPRFEGVAVAPGRRRRQRRISTSRTQALDTDPTKTSNEPAASQYKPASLPVSSSMAPTMNGTIWMRGAALFAQVNDRYGTSAVLIIRMTESTVSAAAPRANNRISAPRSSTACSGINAAAALTTMRTNELIVAPARDVMLGIDRMVWMFTVIATMI